MTLPENVAATYPNRSAGDEAHQTHHDEIHAAVNDLPTNLTSVAAQWTTGAELVYTTANRVWWSARLIVIAHGRGTHFSTDGFFDIAMPSDGTVIPGLCGAADQTVAGGVIQLAAWEALYYILPIGGASTSVPGNFRTVGYNGASFVVPPHWVLIVQRNEDSPPGHVVWGNGTITQYGARSLAAAARREADGSPEGAVAAPVGSTYIDRSATNGAVEWTKIWNGTANTGWRVSYGDTGWRNITNMLHDPAIAAANTGTWLIRRVGDHVVHALMNVLLEPGAGVTDLSYAVPDGFRAGSYMPHVVTRVDNGAAFNQLFLNGSTLTWLHEVLGGSNSVGHPNVGIQGQFDYVTAQQWPTALPGVAA